MKLVAAFVLCTIVANAAVVTGDCVLKGGENQTLYLRPATSVGQADFYPVDQISGAVVLKKGDIVRTACPGSVVRLSGTEVVTVICVANNTVTYEGLPYSVAELICTSQSEQNILQRVERQPKYGIIGTGVGYSSDSQQVVSKVCYNATASTPSEPTSHIHLSSHVSYSELESILGTSLGTNGIFDMFSLEPKISYLRSLKTTDFSLSFNYYYYQESNVDVQILWEGEEALTELGRDFYENGTNEYFRLLCGDHYISSYKQGAMLLMGINIEFDNVEMKQEFGTSLNGSIPTIAAAISSKVSQSSRKITGSVSMQAVQIGGDTTELGGIIGEAPTGQYFIMKCDLPSMQNCVTAANQMLQYANNGFANQLKQNTSFTPLSSQHMPVSIIGLDLNTTSFVDAVVKSYRNKISCKFTENEYYSEKLHSILNGYPVTLDSSFRSVMDQALRAVDSNTAIFMNPINGAAVCYTEPYRCKEIGDIILGTLTDVWSGGLDAIDDIYYTYSIMEDKLYGTGVTWALPGQSLKCLELGGDEYNYRRQDGMHFNGKRSNSDYYYGDLCNDVSGWFDDCNSSSERRERSIFHFTKYDTCV